MIFLSFMPLFGAFFSEIWGFSIYAPGKGVPLTVAGVAQVKVMYQKGQKQILDRACENFIGKTSEEIKEVLQLTLEGHLRAITGQMTVEKIYTDRDEFADLVRETATPDLGKMGIQILSFVLQDIRDDVEYLSSIGRAQAAVVIKEATIGTNNAKRDAKIIESQCDQEKSEVINKCKANIDTARKNYKTMEADCNTKINAAKTEAGLAYDLQKALEEQIIREKEIEVEIIKAQKQIEVEKAEIIRRERELEATERLPAVFEAQRTVLQCVQKCRSGSESWSFLEIFRINFQNCLAGSPFGLVLSGNFENFDFLAENYSENLQK